MSKELKYQKRCTIFYYAFDRQVNPQFYVERQEDGALDELTDGCPGPLIDGPPAGEYMIYTTCGQTNTATNDCTYPGCRYGRDVFAMIQTQGYDWIRITTTGSTFDTYLCLYVGNCCGLPGAYKVGENNNNPSLCNGQRLNAGMQGCLYFGPGTYYIVLDGAGPAAFGHYCLTVEIWGDDCETN